jgi:hypothetical protein
MRRCKDLQFHTVCGIQLFSQAALMRKIFRKHLLVGDAIYFTRTCL